MGRNMRFSYFLTRGAYNKKNPYWDQAPKGSHAFHPLKASPQHTAKREATKGKKGRARGGEARTDGINTKNAQPGFIPSCENL